jgi:hypothetical protein
MLHDLGITDFIIMMIFKYKIIVVVVVVVVVVVITYISKGSD